MTVCLVCRAESGADRLSVTSYIADGRPAGTLEFCSPACLTRAMKRYTVTDPERQSLREQVRDRVRRFRAARRQAETLVTQ
jgi:hypothetical protein